MAIELLEKDNVMPADSDYPYGQIKDRIDGTQEGTPINVKTYGDFHQFFSRMMAIAEISYNNLPDNDYTNFQLFEALIKVVREKSFDKHNPVFATKAVHNAIATTSLVFNYDSALTDVDGILDVATGQFTPPEGLWKISFGVGFLPTNNPSGQIALNVYKNGSAFDVITGDVLIGNNVKTIGFSEYVIDANGTDYYTVVVTNSSMDVNYTSIRLTLEPMNNLAIV